MWGRFPASWQEQVGDLPRMSPSGTMNSCFTRRHFLATQAMGIGGVALTWLLNRDGLLANPTRPELAPRHFDLAPKPPHFEPKARAMISLFMQGGPSHIDLFEPKPMLKRYDSQPFPGTINYDNAAEASAKVL